MLAELILFAGFLVVVYVVGLLLITLAHNYEEHQAFIKKCPYLPQLSGRSIFSGHANKVMYGPRNWKVLDESHKELGQYFGLFYRDIPAVSTLDLDFIKEFAIDDADRNINRPQLGLPISEFEVDSLVSARDDQWRRLRRLTAPAISSHTIKSPIVQAEMDEVIGRLCASIDRKLDQANRERKEDFILVDIEDIAHRFSLAMVFSCFYKQTDQINFDTEKDYYQRLVDKGLRNMIGIPLKVCTAFPVFRPLLSWLMMQFHPNGVMRLHILEFIKRQTRIHLEARKVLDEAARDGRLADLDPNNFTLNDGSQFKRNMMDFVIDHFHDGRLTQTEYLHSLFLMFFAGDKTTSDATSKLLYHLAVHQQVQTKLRQSILEEGLESEYLSWVMFESMRLFPPLIFGCSRQLGRDIKTKVGLIPAGCIALTPVFTIHRLREYWGDDADEFKPERWRNSKSFHPAQYLAFGAGKRSCPGKDLAIREIKLLFNALLTRYKFETCSKTSDPYQFEAPAYLFLVADSPNFIKVSRL